MWKIHYTTLEGKPTAFQQSVDYFLSVSAILQVAHSGTILVAALKIVESNSNQRVKQQTQANTQIIAVAQPSTNVIDDFIAQNEFVVDICALCILAHYCFPRTAPSLTSI